MTDYIKNILDKMTMQNQHKHTSGSNISTPDSAAMYYDYAKRAIELNQTILSSAEHGYQGNYWECFDVANEYGLKFLFGAEAYWVKDRLKEYPEINKETGEYKKDSKTGEIKLHKDKTNSHINIYAKNENGRQAINEALSEANDTGYYYKPRLDLDLILNLPVNDVIVTSACVAFWKYEDIDDIVIQLHNHFKSNFYLEVQYHYVDIQMEINKHIIELAQKYNIELIVGLDSHYILPTDSDDRDRVLLYKGIIYEDEDSFFADYPDIYTVFDRFKEQNVLSDEMILNAIDNTNIFIKCEDYGHIDIFNTKKIKLPTLYPNNTKQEKDQILYDLLIKRWNVIKIEDEIDPLDYPRYEEEIEKEYKVWCNTGMSDYPLLDYEIVKLAELKGGLITDSGRGSGVSYYSNRLLGFTKVDRISSPVKLYPERFISETRILESLSLPDLDLNCGNPEVFAEAQEELLGKGHAYPMIAYGTLKAKSAWKMYAGASNVPFETANEVSQQIEEYETALKYAEDDEKDTIDIYDYVDIKHHEMIDGSKKYLGIISDKKKHPCGYLLFQGDIRKEIGLIKCKSETTKKEYLVALIDGSMCEKYKFMKNDLLKVDVVNIIKMTYAKINAKQPTIKQLSELFINNQQMQDIYAKGITLGINQVEKSATTKKVIKYKPKNPSEVTAFIAGIRPGFKSMYPVFERREEFHYGIKSFDKLLTTEEFTDSFILYQEMIMTALNFAGIPMDHTYDLIKAISKKKEKVIMATKETFINGFTKRIILDEGETVESAEEKSNKVWQIIQDSIAYLFNASHAYCMAIDSLYGVHLKTFYTYEFYETCLNMYSEKGKKDKVSAYKQEMQAFFGIKEGVYKFRKDNRRFTIDREHNSINASMLSIKGFGQQVGDDLYELGKNHYDNFYSLLLDLKKSSANDTHISKLISIKYFDEFGLPKKLLKYFRIFNLLYKAKSPKKSSMSDKLDPIFIPILEKYSRQTDATYMDFKGKDCLIEIFDMISDEIMKADEIIHAQMDVMGYVSYTDESIGKEYIVITNLDTTYSPKFMAYCINNGKQLEIKAHNIPKRGRRDKNITVYYQDKPFVDGDILFMKNPKQQPKKRKINNDWVIVEGVKEWWLKDYRIVKSLEH